MNHIDKPELEELLSAYIDDELSERQRTQVKRLIEHDEKVAEELRYLEKQKQLLAALPVASAPRDILGGVKIAMERKRTLDEAGRVEAGAVDTGGSYARRLLTSAAMILLPVGVLAWVVWTIIMPLSMPPSGPNGPVANGGDPGEAVRTVAISFPLSTSLHLTTPQVISMGNFINKAIYKHNLVNFMSTIGTEDASKTYTITASRDSIVGLLTDLAGVWDKCESTSLTVHGRTMSVHARVEDITAGQAIALYRTDVFDDPLKLAKDFDRMNRFIRSMPGYGIVETAPYHNYLAMGPMTPVEPIMTSDKQKEDPKQTGAANNATLFITITAR